MSSDNSITPKRIYYIDNLKFMTITAVVMGHFLGLALDNSNVFKAIYIFIYSFSMPMFIFISGLFHKNENIKNTCMYYIGLGFASKIIYFISQFIGNPDRQMSFGLLSGTDLPWFMFSLAAFKLLTYFFSKYDLRYILIFSIILSCFTGYDTSIGGELYLSRITAFYPFYLLGYILKNEKLERIRAYKKPVFQVIGLLILICYAVICYKTDIIEMTVLFKANAPFPEPFNFRIYGVFWRLLCYVLSGLQCFAFLMITPDVNIPFITNAGKRTLNVYMWHMTFVYIALYYTPLIDFTAELWGKLLMLAVSIAVSVILSFNIKIFTFPADLMRKVFLSDPSPKNETQ